MYITPRPIYSPVLADSLVQQNRHNRLQSEGTTAALLQQPSNRRDQNEHFSAPAKTFAQTQLLTDSPTDEPTDYGAAIKCVRVVLQIQAAI